MMKEISQKRKKELIRKWIQIRKMNPWISQLGSRNPEDECAFEEPFGESYFYECRTVDELIDQFRNGNWALGQAFYYRNLCFINQVDGGDEWMVIREDIDFESISTLPFIEEDPESLKRWIEQVFKATDEQLINLEYASNG